MKGWITSNEVAEILNTSPDKVNWWGMKGFFGARRWYKNHWLYSVKAVEKVKDIWVSRKLSDIRKVDV